MLIWIQLLRKEVAFGVVYNNEYKKEMDRINGLVMKKQVAEVELFVLGGKPLTDEIKGSWSKEMIEFYKIRVADYEKGKE